MSPAANVVTPTEEQETVIEQFLDWYEANRSGYDQIARLSIERLAQALDEAGVPHRVEYRTKATDRLKVKVNGRKGSRGYKSIDDIRKDIVDLAGARVSVYFPSDKDRVKKFISENFDVHSNSEFKGSQIKNKRVTSHQYVPKYPKYRAEHYRATLNFGEGVEAEPWHKFRVEIQVTTILRQIWAEVGHDWDYKQLVPGGDDELCQQMLDGLSGAFDIGEEFFLENVKKGLVLQKEKGDGPFRSQYDLGTFLVNWAAGSGRSEDLADVQTLWEVLHCFDLHRPTKLRQILDGLDLSPELANEYEPLPLNIETSIIHSIMVSEEGRQQQREGKVANVANVQEYKLKVVRDCFIWFGRLFRFKNKWFLLIRCGNDSQRVVENMEWLRRQSMKEGDLLSRRDERILDDLFDMFAGHSRLAVQYVFFLARLRVKTFQGDGLAMRNVIKPLLEDRALQQRCFR